MGLGQYVVARLVQGFGGTAFIHHRAMGRNPGLQGEACQQGFTEGMDVLDFQPARRIQRSGEQPPRFLCFFYRGFAAQQGKKLIGQLSVGISGPCA